MAEEAFAALRDRYGIDPPLRFVWRSIPTIRTSLSGPWASPGLGALGVSFGSTLVMDSPSALDPGNFNWASTMWHEVAHAFHLAMSDHRVPRWFTEGLAVHEQHMAQSRMGLQGLPGLAPGL